MTPIRPHKYWYYILTLVLLSTFAGMAFAQETELRVSEGDAKRAAIVKPAPEYSKVARDLKVTGVINVEVAIDPSGQVANVKVVKGSPVLGVSVVEALKKWRFKPFVADGKPTRAIAELSFDFSRL